MWTRRPTSNIRRFLNDRQMPRRNQCASRNWCNYFSYDYALPEAGKPVSMTTNLIRSPWNSKRLLLHVGLRSSPSRRKICRRAT